MNVYHYRSVESAVAEIETGSFRLTRRDLLNDPIEGYVRVFWKGDKPAWEGLFKNYICSLLDCLHLYLIQASQKEIQEKAVLTDIKVFDNLPLGEMLNQLGDSFVNDRFVQKIVDIYGTSEVECSASELQLLLRILHFSAFKMSMMCCVNNKLIPMHEAKPYLDRIYDDVDKSPFNALESLIQDVQGTNEGDLRKRILMDFIDGVFRDQIESVYIMQSLKIRSSNDELSTPANLNQDDTFSQQLRNWTSLYMDFPTLYMNRLLKLIYPESYFVCFSGSNDNSAMWGYYADNHKGVCLIYGTTSIDGREMLSETKDSYWMEIKPIEYGGETVARNFFESLGRFTVPQLRTWLSGPSGTSKCIDIYWSEGWREKYWVDQSSVLFRKSSYWEHEKEYRICYTDSLCEHFDAEYVPMDHVDMKYGPCVLKGIIFGIETSIDDKAKLIDVLMKKYESLDCLHFYQAEYDDANQKIRIREKTSTSNRFTESRSGLVEIERNT